MSSVPIETLRHYVNNCDPYMPLTDPRDRRYVDLDAEGLVRGVDGNRMEQIATSILWAQEFEATCQLFTGFPGSGKTTELHRLKHRLEQEDCHVIMLDAMEYLDRYTPLTITDMLRVLAYHLDTLALRAEGKDPLDKGSFLRRVWDLLQSDVDIKEIGFEAYGLNLMAEIKSNPHFRQRAEAILNLRFQDFAQQALQVIERAVVRLRKAVKQNRIVFIVDSLEKLQARSFDELEAMEKSVQMVFTDHAEWLKLPCHVVYTCPFWLRFRTPSISVQYTAPIRALPMLKIRDRDSGALYPPGVEKMLELVQRRLRQPKLAEDDDSDLRAAFGPDYPQALTPLIEASGGYPRDFLRLVRDAIQRSRGVLPITPAIVERVVEVFADEYQMATLRAPLALLDTIGETKRLPTGPEALAQAGQLFEQWLILTYCNGKEWYDLHPLVRRAIAAIPRPEP